MRNARLISLSLLGLLACSGTHLHAGDDGAGGGHAGTGGGHAGTGGGHAGTGGGQAGSAAGAAGTILPSGTGGTSSLAGGGGAGGTNAGGTGGTAAGGTMGAGGTGGSEGAGGAAGQAGASGVAALRLLTGALGGMDPNVRLSYPLGVASYGAGKVYFTDDSAVRAVDVATGAVTTIAGVPDQSGAVDGAGAAARFNIPNGIASDGAGNLYVADSSNFTIRKVVIATGAVTTIAGLVKGGASGPYGYCGYTDGTGDAARFCYPGGIAADGAGNLYIADSGWGTIRKIVIATGQVTTLAGSGGSYGSSADGRGANASFNDPVGIASDRAGNLYVADYAGRTIRKIVIATGDVTTFAGAAELQGSADGIGSTARFGGPSGIVSDGAGNLFVADEDNHTIRKIVIATRAVTTVAGVAGSNGTSDGRGAAAHFYLPHGVSSDGAGHLYVTDTYNHSIRQVVITSADVTTIAGEGRHDVADGTGAGARFKNPAGFAGDGAGNLYIADTANSAIRKVVIATGAVTTIAGAGSPGSADGSGAAARFDSPEGVASDRAGNLYVADTGNNTIRKVAIATGVVTTIAGTARQFGSVDGTGAAARFSGPTSVVTDGGDVLFVADTANSTIRKVALAAGTVTTIAGVGSPGSANGTGAAARFSYPYGIAGDGAGNLYVSDTGNSTIRKIAIATGAVTTIAGKVGVTGSGDGASAAARFSYPYGIASDGAGNLYVADTGSSTIRKVALGAATVSTVIGSPGQVGVALGPLPASLNTPYGVLVLPTGELAITDFSENVVLIGHL